MNRHGPNPDQSPDRSTPHLDEVVRAVQQLSVSAEFSSQQVQRAIAAAPPQQSPLLVSIRRWRAMSAVSWAGAAALALLLLWVQLGGGSDEEPSRSSSVVWLGERVALLAESGSSYRVERHTEERTEVRLDRGTLSARLFPGATPHRLTLAAADVTAAAVGTIYSMRVEGDGPRVVVHEGEVDVVRGDHRSRVRAGRRWRAGREEAVALPIAAHAVLAALTHAPTPIDADSGALNVGVADAGAADTGATDTGTIAVKAEETALGAHRSSSSVPRTAARAAEGGGDKPVAAERHETPRELWREARLRRGQARYREAMALLVELHALQDETYSPLALVEMARLALRAQGDPAAARASCERFLRRYPEHALVPEVESILERARSYSQDAGVR